MSSSQDTDDDVCGVCLHSTVNARRSLRAPLLHGLLAGAAGQDALHTGLDRNMYDFSISGEDWLESGAAR